MQANTFQVGDRVQLIPFKHKGKVATVKYFGAIGRKFGTWVGLELDEPTGEISGDVNGEQLFECRPMHGLLLRNTQVKTYSEESVPVRPRTTNIPNNILLDGSEEEGKAGGYGGDSPLVTPRHTQDDSESLSHKKPSTSTGSASTLMQAMTQAIQNPTAIRSQATANTEEDTKKRGWQERLEKLKEKKQQEKDKARQKTDADALASVPSEEDRVREAFALSSGIQRTTGGGFKISQEEVKKGPSGEEILQKAIKESDDELVTTRSSLASINKIIKTGVSPAKTTGSFVTPAGTATSGSKTARPVQTAKQQELAAKKEEIERQRKERAIKAPVAGVKPVVPPQKVGATVTSTKDAVTKDTTPAKDSLTSRTQTKTAAVGKISAADSKPTIGKISTVPKNPEEEKKTTATATRRPAMSTQSTQQIGMKRSDSRTAASTRQAIGGGAGSPRRSRMEENEAASKPTTAIGAKVPAPTTKPVRATRDRTPGPEIPVPKVNPIEMKKMENTIKDMETENLRLQSQIKTLETEKNSWTKERAEKEAQASKAIKEKNEVLTKVEKEKKEIEDKANREKETIKKTYETKIASLQTQIMSQQEENQQLQASQDDMASLERSKIEEDQAMKVVQLEGMLEEQNIKMKAQESQISESQQLVLEAETKLTEMQIKMAETEQKLKDQGIKIAETEAQHADREQVHTARISDMEVQLKKYQEEMAARAVEVTAENKEYFMRKEEELAARFQETQLTFEKSFIEARDAAKKAQEAEKAALVRLEEEIARRIDEHEIHELEMQTLQDENRDLMDRLMEQGKVEEVDPLKDLGLEEIKLQNKKLRQAITALTFGFEEEKRKLENQMKNETGKDKIIAGMEKRLEEMDFLLEEVERKEKERAEMEEKLEEIVEYENMVEEMVQEIANREEENEDCMERIKELEEENQLLEELNQGLELDNTEMQEDLAKKERELAAAKNEIEQLEGIVIDQDGLTSKYKERQQEFQKQIKVLSEQLAESVNAGNKDQVSILLEKQQQLIARLRDAEKKSLQITKSQITMQQERMGIEVVQNMLPDSLMNEALLPCLKKMQELNFIKHKAMMLLREICETQVDNAANVYADLGQMKQFYGLLLSLSMLSNRLVQSGHRIFFFISNMSPGQYTEITRLLAWEQLEGVTQEIDSFLQLLKEENLNYNQDLTAFENQVRQVEQLQVTVEKTFGTFSPEELKAREELGPSAPEPVTLTKRKVLLKKCLKLSLREQVLTMAVGVVFVPRLSTLYASELERRQVIQKVSLIYWRLLDIVLKLDNVTNTASGDEFIDEETNSTDVRLQQKYVSIKALWEGSAEEKHEASQKSWSSVLESIERDVTSLNNDFKFKQLADRVEAKYGTGKIDFNDLYNIDYKAGGPWRVVSEQVKSELQDMGALKQKNTHLLEKQKEQLKQMALMKKEKDEAVFITQTLKGQLSQAVAKADQVPALEIERNDLQEQIKSVKKQLDAANKDITISRASVEDFKTKLEEAKKQQAIATQQAENEMMIMGSSKQGGLQRGNAIRARTGATKHRSRESGAAYFFKNMHAAGMRMDSQQSDVRASHNKNQSIANSAQILQQMQLSEDIYTETINQLQADRMRLRGKDMFERLTKLQETEGAFSLVTKQLREAEKKREAANKGVAVKLNKAEQMKVQSALESVETLKFKVKKQMASRRIVDLTKAPITPKPEEAKNVEMKQPNFTETFNYMVMETREKINDAMQVLFTKDSKLRKLHVDYQPAPPATPNPHQDPKQVQSLPANSLSLNQVKVGSLRLRSKIKIPQNRVLLDESALAELRRNVALFAAN